MAIIRAGFCITAVLMLAVFIDVFSRVNGRAKVNDLELFRKMGGEVWGGLVRGRLFKFELLSQVLA